MKCLALFVITFFFFSPVESIAQARGPELGAEIFIEPGQTTEEVDHWVKILADENMPIARVFMMWNYLEPRPGVWDFKLYDALFNAAEKYGVKITVTLTPNQPPFFWGKEFFYYTHDMGMYRKKIFRERSKIYIRKIVERYKNSPALDSWWLYNEPNGYPRFLGSNDFKKWAFGIDKFQNWLETKYINIDSLNNAWQSYFPSFDDITFDERWLNGGWVWQMPFYDWFNFSKNFINRQIDWLRKEVLKYDTTHFFTTNPPGAFTSLAHYDLPDMKKTVDVLGGSLHPSWNFSWVPRHKYGLAVSWVNDLLRGVVDKDPYWISELQGGANWHGKHPLNPSPNDIAQWVWTSVGTGASRVIFWLLNSRMQGNESTEWSLLDFQQQPSERMKKASEIASIITHNKNKFKDAEPIISPITVILDSRTLLMQERKNEALNHQKAAMACYNALMEQGIPVNLKLIDEYDWKTNKVNKVAILPDVLSLTNEEINNIKTFVKNGNKIIATGLTGLYDENEKSWIVNQKFLLKKALGGTFKDILSNEVKFNIKLNNVSLPTQIIYSEIAPMGGQVVGKHNGKPIALVNRFGKGETVWIPSMVGLGAWDYGEEPLADFLKQELRNSVKSLLFQFNSFHEDCYMHTLKTQKGFITVIVNGSEREQNIKVLSKSNKKPDLIYGSDLDTINHSLTMPPNSTVVLSWE